MTSLVEIYRRFPDREAAVAHLEQVRWPHGPECPLCGSTGAARHAEKGQADRWQCWDCHKSFSATVGTIFHNSHVDLQRWFLLISLMLKAKKGLSAMQAARDLDMRRPTVWSMMHRIRGAMQDDGRLLSGLVEMDEAYVGGKPRKRNRRDDDTPSPRGRGTSKTHTNTIESFWAIVKRAFVGQFHAVSVKYLPLYLRELAFRYNLRNGGCDLDNVLHLAIKP